MTIKKETIINELNRIEKELKELKKEIEVEEYEYWNGEDGITYYIYPDNRIEIIQRNHHTEITPAELIELKEIFFDSIIKIDELEYSGIIFIRDMVKSIFKDYFKLEKI